MVKVNREAFNFKIVRGEENSKTQNTIQNPTYQVSNEYVHFNNVNRKKRVLKNTHETFKNEKTRKEENSIEIIPPREKHENLINCYSFTLWFIIFKFNIVVI